MYKIKQQKSFCRFVDRFCVEQNRQQKIICRFVDRFFSGNTPVCRCVPSEKENRRNELLLKLFFASHATKQELLKQLQGHQEKFEELKEEYKIIETNIISQITDQHPQKPYWIMTMRYGIIHVEAELKWLQECIHYLERN